MSILTRPSGFVTDLVQSLRGREAEAPDVPLDELMMALLSSPSETQQLKLARQILLRYHHGDRDQHLAFFELLLAWDIDPDVVSDAACAYRAQGTAEAYAETLRAAEPKRKEIFRRLSNVSGGVACLVKIREDLRRELKREPDYARIDHDLHHLLASWFNRGFLELRPVTWHSPADVLEKIIAHEAVHTIRDWDDLRRRVQPADRRCYGFFHPRMPDDPLIFVEVALSDAIPSSVDALLAADRCELPLEAATTACFYSISNCHPGLAGISFGNALIKQVARTLGAELPQVRTFVTLSPIPGLRRWTEAQEDAPPLPLSAARHLAEAKRGDGRPLDPVARFHLGNGAALHAIHTAANGTEAGQAQSYGAMVNYLYDLPHVDARTEAYAFDGTVELGQPVRDILTPPKRARRAMGG